MNYNFNVGDTVILTTGWQGRCICTVERITSAGNIAVSGLKDVLFKPDGVERGGNTYSRRYIHPASPDEIADLEHQQLIVDVKNKMGRILRNLTYEQAKELSMTSLFQRTEKEILTRVLEYLDDSEKDLKDELATASGLDRTIVEAKISAVADIIDYAENYLGVSVRTVD